MQAWLLCSLLITVIIMVLKITEGSIVLHPEQIQSIRQFLPQTFITSIHKNDAKSARGIISQQNGLTEYKQ